MTWTRFCHPCRAKRVKEDDRRFAKKRIQRLKDNRLCLWCGDDPAVEGSQFCEDHRERMNAASEGPLPKEDDREW